MVRWTFWWASSMLYLNLADKLLWLAAASNIHKLMVAGKLVSLALRWANG